MSLYVFTIKKYNNSNLFWTFSNVYAIKPISESFKKYVKLRKQKKNS